MMGLLPSFTDDPGDLLQRGGARASGRVILVLLVRGIDHLLFMGRMVGGLVV
jgi:hypothetical protein